MYQAEATNPQGFDPKDLAGMNTAAQQSEGGALASVEGEGKLNAARTRNRGALAPAIGRSFREGSADLAQKSLETQQKNALLKEGHRQEGIGGMQGLYGSNVNELLSSLGLSNQATQTGVEAGKSGWFQNFLGFLNAASNAGKAASGFM